MSLDPICLFVYVNGEIICSTSGNAVFTSDNTKSMLLYPIMMLPNIIIVIQSSIRVDDVSCASTSLWYHCPIYEMNGHVEYRACRTIDEEGV